MAEILLYDEIGENWWSGGGISASKFVQMLAAAGTAEPLTVRINSPGGDVFEAVAIYNALKAHPVQKTIVIDGLAASAASFIAMAGDKIIAHEGSMIMIHMPWAGVTGTADDMRKVADLLDKVVNDSNIPIYSGRTGQPADKIKEWLAAETWFSAAEAVANGFADEVDPVKAIAPPKTPTERYRKKWQKAPAALAKLESNWELDLAEMELDLAMAI